MESKSYSGNRGVNAEVTMSFMCSTELRERIRETTKGRDEGISEFVRRAVEKELREIHGQ